MFEDLHLYALHDYDDNLRKQGSIDLKKYAKNIIELEDIATEYNRKGYGIFWVVNDYIGQRKKINLTNINYWFTDIDGGDKISQLLNIRKLNLPPSFIIESANGYHCYWAVKGTATIENFEKIENGIIERVGGDKGVKDPLRLLRAPGYYHSKNPVKPFLINIVLGEGSEMPYTENQMMRYFVREEKHEVSKPCAKYFTSDKKDFLDEKKWETIFKISDIVDGNRNSTLARYTFWLKDEGLNNSEIKYIINGINNKSVEPLPVSEVTQILKTKGVA